MEIKNLQLKVDNWIKNHGVRYFNELTNMAQLSEEVGEVARIIARRYGEQSEKDEDKIKDLGEELADVIFVVICIANQTGVDLQSAFDSKLKVKSKRDWVENRMGDGDGDWTQPYDAVINEKNYMQGCAMGGGRILRQMEVLVDGQTVLCCDDAEGKTNYGNVFEIGIEKAWNNLQKEHSIINDRLYRSEKKDLDMFGKAARSIRKFWYSR